MVTIQINDPFVEKIVQKEGMENITNEILIYIQNKFSKKYNLELSKDLDMQIKASKIINKQRTERLKNAMDNLNLLIDDDKKNLSLNEVKEQYYNRQR